LRYYGVLVAAAVVTFVPEVVRSLALYRMVVFGLAMILMMMFRPGGIWPRRRGGTEALDLLARLGRRGG
jgi:branched-chain amino acid transport system permease protein